MKKFTILWVVAIFLSCRGPEQRCPDVPTFPLTAGAFTLSDDERVGASGLRKTTGKKFTISENLKKGVFEFTSEEGKSVVFRFDIQVLP